MLALVPFPRSFAWVLTGAFLWVLACAATGQAGPAQAEGARKVPGAFRVSLPNPSWSWGAAKARSLSLSRGEAGLEVVLTWADNQAHIESQRAATKLRYRLMMAESSVGRQFSSLRKGTVGGRPSTSFTVEQQATQTIVHRTQYTTVAAGGHCLVIMVMGPSPMVKLYTSEIRAIIDSVCFLRA